MNESLSQQNQVEALAEEFLERRRKGERPTIAEYTAKYPELAEEIRACFPALLLVEDLKPNAADLTGPAATADGQGLPPERLGDYRILREVGRGGMGVVYEAEQESLGRHVALKVLPAQALLDPKHVQRFHREARAAARLHHTNIVPVFGVGADGGLHYYVMQFIHGLGLDQVLDELQRLRQGRNGTAAEAKGPERSAAQPLSAAGIADALRTGQFTRAPQAAPAASGASTPAPAALAVAPATSDSATAIHLPGQAEHSTLSESGRGYWPSVARIGVQVAEALAHAHAQGILHRDIKPANLLLDMQGTVWVTDFGLAKADGGDGLTQEGEIVGTLRYMAPERFGGASDVRGDVYGLGVTLYELLTLRPAFAEADRHQLLHRVLHEEPPRPRRVNPEVPRDLETIVLKAIAKEPRQRYASAAEVAEDLRRFLADRPVKARRASALERLWRWVRRNPALAAALGAAVALLLAVAAVASWDAWRLHGEQRATQHQLYGALVAQARASRRSRTAGQRFESLGTLEQAAQLARQLNLPQEDFLELRNEVIACLALPDVRVAKEWDCLPEAIQTVSFDSRLERYARADRQWNITVRRVADDAELCHFPSGTGGWPFLSPDGRFLLVSNVSSGQYKLWDVAGPGPRVIPVGETVIAGAFRRDSPQVALAQPNGSISLHELPSGRLLRRLDAGPVPRYLAFRPDGRQLAVACQNLTQVRDLETGNVCAEFPGPPGAYLSVAWHPDGKTLATVGGDRIIRLWDVATRKKTVQLEGGKGDSINLTFNRAGDLLVSNGWEGTLRLWDPRTGQQLFQVRANGVGAEPRFGPDDRLLAAEVTERKLRLLEVAASRAYCTLVHDPVLGKGGYLPCAVSPKGRLLVAGMGDGLGFWDLQPRAPVGFVRLTGGVCSVVFEAEGALLTNGPGGAFRWPVQPDPASPGLVRIGPPQRLPFPGTGGTQIACSPDGRVVASAQYGGGLVWLRDRPGKSVRLSPHVDTRFISVSTDGRWVATGSHGGTGAKVWDAATGELAADLVPTHPAWWVRFSPDGKWLAACTSACRLWAVGSWQEGPSLGVTTPGTIAFSPDGRLLAMETGQNTVRLLDPDTGREYARLEDPNQDRARDIAFSPDGTQLVVTGEAQWLHVWDLRAIRAELARRDLDWDLPPYPPPADPPDAPPVRVAVDLGELAQPKRSVEERARLDIERFRQALAKKPEDAPTCNNLAWAYLMAPEPLRDGKAAVLLAEKAVRKEPKNPTYCNTLGLAYYRTGQYRQAVEVLRPNLQSQEPSALTYDLYILAMSCHRLGETERARDYYTWAVRSLDAPKGPSPAEPEDLSALRAEAEAVLGLPPPPAPADKATAPKPK
jgi:WD40 repeat protein